MGLSARRTRRAVVVFPQPLSPDEAEGLPLRDVEAHPLHGDDGADLSPREAGQPGLEEGEVLREVTDLEQGLRHARQAPARSGQDLGQRAPLVAGDLPAVAQGARGGHGVAAERGLALRAPREERAPRDGQERVGHGARDRLEPLALGHAELGRAAEERLQIGMLGVLEEIARPAPSP